MSIRIKTTTQKAINVKTRIAVPENLSGVENVDINNIQDGYILMYDDERQRYAFRNPDEILSKTVVDSSLPQNFVDKLDSELDNKIIFDGGLF